jgi:HEAT repeat protein
MAKDEGPMSAHPRHITSNRQRFLAPLGAVLASAALAIGLLAADARAQAPGPETFAKEPKTPSELWDAVDYLVRTGQPKAAVPYLTAFLSSKPDDAALLAIRDRYGAGSVLRLNDYPETRAQARQILEMLNAASRRYATNPERLKRAIAALSKTKEEQAYGLERLREAGPYAVPALIEAISNPNTPAEERKLIVANMGRLDHAAIPALIAALDSPDQNVAANAADALGRIGDPRAVPSLTYPAAQPNEGALRGAARLAIARLTGLSFASQTRSPIRVLVDEARKYQMHQVQFPADSVVIWSWEAGGPTPSTVSKSEAEAIFGLRFAREALNLDPTDRAAQVVFISLSVEKAIERVGMANFLTQDPTGAFAAALAAGPSLLGDVAHQAMADGHSDLAAAALVAFGRVADRDALARTSVTPNPLVEALSAPDRRVRLAAAQALVSMAPPHNFPGASRVVPVLTSFIATRSVPKVVIIDGDANRGNGVGRVLKALGYDFASAQDGTDGFKLTAESADVEAVFIEPTFLQGSWRLVDILTNLRGDARTAGLPIFVYGPERLADHLQYQLSNTSRIAFVVTPTNPDAFLPVWEREMLRIGSRPLSPNERETFSQIASTMLGQIASRPGNPFEVNISEAEPALTAALSNPATGLAASTALGDVPGLAAQRSLADALIDPSKPAAMRLSAANQLARSLQRFGRLVTRQQEQRLQEALDGETTPELRFALSEVVGALRPDARPIGTRLRNFKLPRAQQAPPAPTPAEPPAAVRPAEPAKPANPAPPVPGVPPPAPGAEAEPKSRL